MLVGARNLDPFEREFLAATGLRREDGLDEVLAEADGVYVALDADVVEPGELAVFMPEPGGLMLEDLEALLRRIAHDTPVVGAGLTGLRPAPANVAPLARLCAALGL